MKIAIIDSGIIKNHIFEKSINNFCHLYVKDNYIFESNEIIDDNGHGTLCASTILKYCPDSIFDIYKISDKEGNSHIEQLILALEKILEQKKTKLINISMSFKKDKISINDFEYIQSLLKNIKNRGTIIISSVDNDSWSSYPSLFSNVVGVYGKRNILNVNRFFYSKKHKLYWTSNLPYLHMDNTNDYTLFGASNSYCSAKITGLIASILSEKKQPLNIGNTIVTNVSIYKNVINNLKKVDARIVNGYIYYNDIRSDTYKFLKSILIDMHIDLDFHIITSFSLYDFITVDRICNKIMEVIRCQYH